MKAYIIFNELARELKISKRQLCINLGYEENYANNGLVNVAMPTRFCKALQQYKYTTTVAKIPFKLLDAASTWEELRPHTPARQILLELASELAISQNALSKSLGYGINYIRQLQSKTLTSCGLAGSILKYRTTKTITKYFSEDLLNILTKEFIEFTYRNKPFGNTTRKKLEETTLTIKEILTRIESNTDSNLELNFTTIINGLTQELNTSKFKLAKQLGLSYPALQLCIRKNRATYPVYFTLLKFTNTNTIKQNTAAIYNYLYGNLKLPAGKLKGKLFLSLLAAELSITKAQLSGLLGYSIGYISSLNPEKPLSESAIASLHRIKDTYIIQKYFNKQISISSLTMAELDNIFKASIALCPSVKSYRYVTENMALLYKYVCKVPKHENIITRLWNEKCENSVLIMRYANCIYVEPKI